MKARQVILQRLVQVQQRLLRERQVAAGHAATEAALRAVRQRNHAILQHRLGALMTQPGYRAAAHFFFEHLYPLDWPMWRDEQCLRTFPRMCRVMPLAACEVLLQAVELDALTHDIDARTLAIQPADDARHRILRREQQAAVVELGRGLASIARLPMMTLLLRCTGPLARRQSLGELHAFFAAGLDAFLSMPDPHAALDAVAALEIHRG